MRLPAAVQVGGIEAEEDDPMSPAEFRMVREHLGLGAEWLAVHLGVALRTVRRWEGGVNDVPDGVREQMEQLEMIAAAQVGALVEYLQSASEVVLSIPSVDAGGFPARWWRMVAVRGAEEVPGLTVRYADAD